MVLQIKNTIFISKSIITKQLEPLTVAVRRNYFPAQARHDTSHFHHAHPHENKSKKENMQ